MYSIRGGGPGLYEFSIQISARPLTSGMVFALPRPSSGSSSVQYRPSGPGGNGTGVPPGVGVGTGAQLPRNVPMRRVAKNSEVPAGPVLCIVTIGGPAPTGGVGGGGGGRPPASCTHLMLAGARPSQPIRPENPFPGP